MSLDLAKFFAGLFGAIASLKFVNGTVLEKFFMVVGGSALSYYAATPLATWSGMLDSEGLVGFLVGLFGMALVAKTYEVVQLLDAKAISYGVVDGIRRFLGLAPRQTVEPIREQRESESSNEGERRGLPDR